MSNKPIQIKKEEPAFKSMDFFFLREEGIQLVQQLSGKTWTDYNTHDPGVTILEQLCYALADLGFRTDFKIQDLLNARTKNQRKELNNTFYDASEILPVNPVSLKDYRKLIIDQVLAVKNAWIQPVFDHIQGIKGLYKILLQVDDSIKSKQEIDKVKKEVFLLFNKHRNLCEDLDRIEVLEIDKITIFADIEIISDIVAEEVLAEILYKIEEYFNPSVKFYNIEELVDEGYSIDKILDGPIPLHGIIKDEELRPLRQELYISQIVELINNIDGVRRISFFKVEKDGFSLEGDVIRITDNTYPVLDMDCIDERWKTISYPIRFFRAGLNYDLDLNNSNQLLYSHYARYKKGYKMKMLYNEKNYPSILNKDQIPKYYSIQNNFPGTYGLSRYGLPNHVKASRERLAMIKQLRAYLLFFEQIMANYLAQLSNINSFFSLENDLDKTYFSQIPKDVPDLLKIVLAKDETDFQNKLNILMSEFDPYFERRNRILDHLLARFGEQFSTDFLMKLSHHTGTDDTNLHSPEKELIHSKIKYLKNYLEISRDRSCSADYLCIYNLIKNQEIAWLNFFEESLNDNKEKSTVEDVVTNFKKMRENYSFDQQINDIFSFALEYASIDNLLENQHSKLLNGIILTEDQRNKFLELNRIFLTKSKDLLSQEVSGLEKRICLLLNIELDANESLLRSYNESKYAINFQDHISFISPDISDGYIDLEEELNVEHNQQSDLSYDDSVFESVESSLEQESLNFKNQFIFRASNINEHLEDLFKNGIFSSNYVILGSIHPKSKESSFNIYYKGNKSLGCYKIHEAESKELAHEKINSLIRYIKQINRETEGIHLVEHILLRPQASDRHGFKFANDEDRILLQSYHLGSFEDQKNIASQLDIIASRKENYTIEKENDSFSIFLKEYDQIIAFCPDVFYTLEGAKDKIADLIDYILSFKNNPSAIQNYLQFYLEEKKEISIDPDFYSLSLSVVMPSWPSRFQNSDFRNVLKNLFIANAPAHLDCNFYWLNYNQTLEFEKLYFEWMKAKADLDPKQPDLDNSSLKLVEFLQQCKTR
jgi:hypothetical protein